MTAALTHGVRSKHWERLMFQRIGIARITLCAVVLDIPDRSGRYIAKDLAAGWAYMLMDNDGDNRFRGEGTCHGGRDMALRWAFLAAFNCVPDCSQVQIVVEGRETHRCMVGLAVADTHVRTAIDGRPIAVLSRPDEKAVWQARMAAERAASALLRDRERAEARLTALRNADERMAELSLLAGDPRNVDTIIPMADWRAHRAASADMPRAARPVAPVRQVQERPMEVMAATQPRGSSLVGWFKGFNSRVSTVHAALVGIGV